MEPIPCVNCATFFIPRNRKQNYCTKAGCQRARKAAWQRFKLKFDEQYRIQQHLSHQKWLQSNPGYYRSYRRRNPDKVKRNRALQTIRNRRNRRRSGNPKSAEPSLIAKMEARKFCHFNMVGQFYLVPVIAKMDVSRVNIYKISDCYL
jgi:hypothetical protein